MLSSRPPRYTGAVYMSEPTPTVSPLPEREYLQHLAEGRFMIQRSRASGRFVF